MNKFNAAVWVIALICFWACCHLGELTVASIHLFDPSKHVCHSATVHFWSITQDGQLSESIHFHIPWTKSMKQEGADIVASSHDSLSPAKAF